MSGSVPDMAIGSTVWPGLAKLAEECAEVQQVIAKLMAFPDGEHPDGGGPLARRLAGEMGDLLAAIDYVRAHNRRISDYEVIRNRVEKTERFERWHMEEALR